MKQCRNQQRLRKNSSFLEKIAKISSFQIAKKSYTLVNFFLASDLYTYETIYVRPEFEIEFILYFERHHIETMIQKRD